jgi:hypothetical protein
MANDWLELTSGGMPLWTVEGNESAYRAHTSTRGHTMPVVAI